MTKTLDSNFDVCVVGGAGHVGVPLALVLADNAAAAKLEAAGTKDKICA